jgi:hypothetical protein
MYKPIIIVGVVVAVIAAGWLTWSRQKDSGVEFKDDHISFSYPSDYKSQAVLPAEKHSKNLLRLVINQPISIIDLNKETGAIIGANITKAPFLDYISANAERNFSRAYSSYQKGSSERLQLSGQSVAHITFSYTGKDNKTRLFMHSYLITSGNDAYYLYVQSTDKKRADSDAKKIQKSLKIY